MDTATHDLEQSIRPWLIAQRIGIAAFAVAELPTMVKISAQHTYKAATQTKFDELHGIFQTIWVTLEDALYEYFNGQHELEYERRRLGELPPSALHLLDTMLTKTPRADLSSYIEKLGQDLPERELFIQLAAAKPPLKGKAHDLVEKALSQQNSGEQPKEMVAQVLIKDALAQLYEGELAPLQRARILAYHIMDSTASVRRIVQLGASFWKAPQKYNPWNKLFEDSTSLREIEFLLQKIRIPHTDTWSVLSHIVQLGQFLQATPEWPQVQNILTSQVFCWPLLVSSYEQLDTAFSLPVAIDIVFDGKQEVVVENLQPQGNHRSGVNVTQWQAHLEEAANAAKVLWLAKHGNHGSYGGWRQNPNDFRWKVSHASVIFNFYWANRILGDMYRSPGEGSADTYFAMAVLAKLLGRRSYVSSAVTGVLGRQCEEDGRPKEDDFWVKAPNDIPAKLRYVFAARTFERLALPKAVEVALQGGASAISQTAEIAYGTKLSHFADIVQIAGWRQYRYIRCPELQWAIHETYHAQQQRPGLLSETDPRVDRVLQLLRNNRSPVLDLQNEQTVTPRAVASALWYINSALRCSLPSIPPMFSWLFSRVTHDQQDSRFWEVIWRAIGAPMADFEYFYQASSPAKAARMLAEVLNCFQPPEGLPGHRAYDIIVMVGADEFKKSIERTENRSARNLAVKHVLDELSSQGELKVAPSAHDLIKFLGLTRIILLRDCREDDPDSVTPKMAMMQLSRKEQVALVALSTFRTGFTHAMAALMLNSPALEDYKNTWGSMPTFLRGLQEQGVLRYGQGWYHLPPSLWTELYSTLSGIKRVQYHLAAGTALAPYTLATTVPSLAFDRAFLPENIYEADFHLDRATWLANENKNDKLWKNAQSMAIDRTARLLRFAASQTWSTIGCLADCPRTPAYRDGYAMGMELVGKLEKSHRSVHPMYYLNTAECGVRWLKDEPRPLLRTTLESELFGADNLFEKALKACEDPEFQSDGSTFNRLTVLSRYTIYLRQKGLRDSPQVKAFEQEIWQLLDAGENAKGIRGEWFEEQGDEETAHVQAAHKYRLGVQWVHQWHQLWIKAIGAASLVPEDLTWVFTALQEYSDQRAARYGEGITVEDTVVYMLGSLAERRRPSASVHVKERWNAGVKWLEENFGHSYRILRTLQQLKSYYEVRASLSK